MFLGGRWYTLALPKRPAGTRRADALDVEVLQRDVLGPLLKIGDSARTSASTSSAAFAARPSSSGSSTSGQAAVAFSLYPGERSTT